MDSLCLPRLVRGHTLINHPFLFEPNSLSFVPIYDITDPFPGLLRILHARPIVEENACELRQPRPSHPRGGHQTSPRKHHDIALDPELTLDE